MYYKDVAGISDKSFVKYNFQMLKEIIMNENELENKVVEANNYFVYGYNQKALNIMNNILDNSTNYRDNQVFGKLVGDLQMVVKDNNKSDSQQNISNTYDDFSKVADYLGINEEVLSQD